MISLGCTGDVHDDWLADTLSVASEDWSPLPDDGSSGTELMVGRGTIASNGPLRVDGISSPFLSTKMLDIGLGFEALGEECEESQDVSLRSLSRGGVYGERIEDLSGGKAYEAETI